jgi:RNA polymerase sigma factor (sigma-70 family)
MTLALRAAPGSADWSEHELVALVRRGDDRGFEELYGRYRGRIGTYVLGMVADHGRAVDITQDVFISAPRRMRETERPIAFKPWIHEIARNACIDQARRTRRVQEVSLSAEPEPQSVPEASLRAPTLDSAFEARQQLSDLRGAFGCLSENHHRILVMRELEGRSYEHIGDRLGMSRGMVESTLFRARRKLGEEYEELVSGKRCEFVQGLVDEREPRSLGIRERRRATRHISHCQPCRRHAHLAGFDDSQLKPASIGARIAGLLPFPILPWRGLWRGRGRPRYAASGSWLTRTGPHRCRRRPDRHRAWGAQAGVPGEFACRRGRGRSRLVALGTPRRPDPGARRRNVTGAHNACRAGRGAPVRQVHA